MSDDGAVLKVGDGENPQDAFLIFPLYSGDIGQIAGRTARPEYSTRKPTCVTKFDHTEIVCTIHNLGTLPSDLIVLEHQFIFCTLPAHGPGDGFTVGHSGEVSGEPVDAIINTAYVAAHSTMDVRFQVPQFPFGGLANIYFRCRIGTLWAPAPPKNTWDFSRDPRLVEAHLRMTP